MDFDFSPGEKAFFTQLSTELAAVATSDDDGEADLSALAARLRGDLARLAATPYLRLAAEGQTAELGAAALVAATELLADRSPSLCLAVESSVRLLGRALAAFGADRQKARWLAPLVEGRAIGAIAIPPPTLGAAAAPPAVRAEVDGDSVVVTGEASLVVNAPLADLLGVVGLVGDRAAIVLVERGARGLAIGERLTTSAYGGAAIAGLALDRCRVAAEAVVPGPDGVDLVAVLRRWESLAAAGASLGLMKTCLDGARRHARTQTAGPGGKPLVKHQEISFKLAEMLTLYQTSRLLAFRASWLEGTRSGEAGPVIDCAKVFCTESAEQVASAALQVLSTAGLVTPNPVERAFRCAKHGQTLGTSTEAARMQIGDDVLARWG